MDKLQWRRDPLALVCVVAFVSGFASLVYQIQWQRELSVMLGVSHYATTVVLLTFFLGFGLGAWLMHGKLNPDRNPFLWMLVVEGVTGAYAALSPWVFDVIERAGGLVLRMDHAGLLRTLEAGGFAVSGLLLPTVCMGATLPVFYSAAIRSLSTKSTRLSLLAGINTTGALTGSIVVTFYWMGSVPSDRQILWAAGLNGLGFVVSGVLYLFYRHDRLQDENPPHEFPTSSDRRLAASYFLTGAAALGLELIWTRMVYLSLDHTIYTFALTLTVYLWSFSAGLFLSAPVMRRFPPTRNTQAVILGLALISTIIGFQLFRGGLHAGQLAPRTGYATAAVMVTVAFVFLPSLFFGIATPQILHLLTRRLSLMGKDASRLLLFNNLGSVSAIFVVGFVLLPRLGIRWASFFCLMLLAGAFLLLIDLPPISRLARTGGMSLAVVGILTPLWLGTRDLNAGHFRLFYQQPVSVLEDESGLWGLDRSGPGVVLKLNGYYENHLPLPPVGTIQGDFLIPAMVLPEVRNVFMVGLGLGVGAYELLRLPEVRTFHAAEISRGAQELAESVWNPYRGGFFRDSRFQSRIEDGRLVLAHSNERYDAIISGTNRSFYAGSTHIYSLEYWRMVRDRLTDTGMLLQWLPMYSEESALSLLRTFTNVFPGALVVRYQQYYYLLGFKHPELIRIPESITAAYERRSDILKSTIFPTPESFLASVYRLRSEPPPIETPMNSDQFPFVEYSFRWTEGREPRSVEKIIEAYIEPVTARPFPNGS